LDQVITFAKVDDFDRTIQTNLKPVFLLSKFASKLMIRSKWGRIINITGKSEPEHTNGAFCANEYWIANGSLDGFFWGDGDWKIYF
jgi:NAD(P)-dependent dehydrogenase (short-subunit alcohol dehydrogenase family)